MTARRWDGTAWVPFNELLSRFGDAQSRPVIRHYQDGVFGIGWYPLRSIKRWTGTAWVNVYQARIPPPPPPPKPDPITGITPPPPPPPPVQGPVIFDDEGIPQQLNDIGEIIPFVAPTVVFDLPTVDDGTPTDLAGTFTQQQALLRRNIGNLKTATESSRTRRTSIIRQRARYETARANINNAVVVTTIRRRLQQGSALYKARLNPSRTAVDSFTTLIGSATSVRDKFSNEFALAVDIAALRTVINSSTTQRNAERTANSSRDAARENLRQTHNRFRSIPSFLGSNESFLPRS